MTPRVCEYCDVDFKTSRRDKRFCTEVCRKSAERSRWAARKREGAPSLEKVSGQSIGTLQVDDLFDEIAANVARLSPDGDEPAELGIFYLTAALTLLKPKVSDGELSRLIANARGHVSRRWKLSMST